MKMFGMTKWAPNNKKRKRKLGDKEEERKLTFFLGVRVEYERNSDDLNLRSHVLVNLPHFE